MFSLLFPVARIVSHTRNSPKGTDMRNVSGGVQGGQEPPLLTTLSFLTSVFP